MIFTVKNIDVVVALGVDALFLQLLVHLIFRATLVDHNHNLVLGMFLGPLSNVLGQFEMRSVLSNSESGFRVRRSHNFEGLLEETLDFVASVVGSILDFITDVLGSIRHFAKEAFLGTGAGSRAGPGFRARAGARFRTRAVSAGAMGTGA